MLGVLKPGERRNEMAGLHDLSRAMLTAAGLKPLPGDQGMDFFAVTPRRGPRTINLRHNVTVYDACYVALAEVLGCELVTGDRRLAHAAGPGCPIRVLSATSST